MPHGTIYVYYSRERRLVDHNVVEGRALVNRVSVAHDHPFEHHATVDLVLAAHDEFKRRYRVFYRELG